MPVAGVSPELEDGLSLLDVVHHDVVLREVVDDGRDGDAEDEDAPHGARRTDDLAEDSGRHYVTIASRSQCGGAIPRGRRRGRITGGAIPGQRRRRITGDAITGG